MGECREICLKREAWGQLIQGLVCQAKQHKILNVIPKHWGLWKVLSRDVRVLIDCSLVITGVSEGWGLLESGGQLWRCSLRADILCEGKHESRAQRCIWRCHLFLPGR